MRLIELSGNKFKRCGFFNPEGRAGTTPASPPHQHAGSALSIYSQTQRDERRPHNLVNAPCAHHQGGQQHHKAVDAGPANQADDHFLVPIAKGGEAVDGLAAADSEIRVICGRPSASK